MAISADLAARVFVDPLTVYPNAWGPFRKGSSHMFARLADVEALHAVAKHLGLKREWFQGDRDGGHYDLNVSKRLRAVQCGVVELDRAAAVAIWRENRAALAQGAR